MGREGDVLTLGNGTRIESYGWMRGRGMERKEQIERQREGGMRRKFKERQLNLMVI